MIRPAAIHAPLLCLLLLLSSAVPVFADGPARAARPYAFDDSPLPERDSAQLEKGDRLPSNSVIDLELFGPTLYAATGQGLAIFTGNDPLDLDAGLWRNATEEQGLGKGGVSGLAIGTSSSFSGSDTVIWAATAFDTTIAGVDYAAGGGVGYSLDGGLNWTWMGQPVDDRDETEFSPTTTNVQNISYDIALLDERVWLASWGGGLRYLDMDEDSLQWVNQPPDTLAYDVIRHFNHRAFSVTSLDSQLWVGTAAGINVSYDNGQSWRNFSHDPDAEATPSGNFVPSLGAQKTSDGRRLIWAATWVVEPGSGEFYGVSVSEDGGLSWRRVLGTPDEPVRAHNFAFDDSVVYVASDQGFFKSSDFGESWGQFPAARDRVSSERFYGEEVFSTASGSGRLYLGGPEGLAISSNGGLDWTLVRSYPEPGVAGEPGIYAYPNPFSPARFPVVRFQFSLDHSSEISIEVYDFALELVVRPVSGVFRNAGSWSEAWDGLGPEGQTLANGVYFYRLKAGGEERWGKLLLLD